MVAVNSCFFCLKGTISKSKSDRDKLNLKWLYRHLKINSESEVKYFCKECLEIVKKFNELYGQFEAIQVQLEYCLGRIEKKIGKKKDKTSEDGKLRNRIGAKCDQMMSELKPVVKIKKLECPSGPSSAIVVKEEVPSPISNEVWSREVPMVEQDGEIVGAIAELGEDSRSQPQSESQENGDDNDNEMIEQENEVDPTKSHQGYTSVSIDHRTDKSELRASYNKKTKSCLECQKSFRDFGKFTRHFEQVHLKLRYTCDICKIGYVNRDVLKKHLSKPHRGNWQELEGHQEEPEPILNSNRVSLDYRISNSQLRKNYVNKRCRLCHQFCQSPMYFERHYISAHLKLKFTCDICDTEYTRRDYLKVHLKNSHPEHYQQIVNEKENISKNLNRLSSSPVCVAGDGNFDLWLPPGKLLEGLEDYEGIGDAPVPELDENQGIPTVPEEISNAVTPEEVRSARNEDGDDNDKMEWENEVESTKSHQKGYTSVSIDHKTDESLLRANYNKKSRRCRKCQKSYAHFNHFRKHFESVHLKLRFTCDICKIEYTSRQTLKKHLSQSHPEVNENQCIPEFPEDNSMQ